MIAVTTTHLRISQSPLSVVQMSLALGGKLLGIVFNVKLLGTVSKPNLMDLREARARSFE